jgi:hypothetical protein
MGRNEEDYIKRKAHLNGFPAGGRFASADALACTLRCRLGSVHFREPIFRSLFYIWGRSLGKGEKMLEVEGRAIRKRIRLC